MDHLHLKFHKNLLLRTPLLAQKNGLTEKELKDYLQRPEVSEAIFLASPYLCTQIQPYINDEVLKDQDRLVRAYYSYLIRMMNRPTPFGKFAGFSKAAWGKATMLNFGIGKLKETVFLHSRLLHKVVRQLEKKPAIRFKLRYYPNSSISWKKERITYIFQEYRALDKLPVLNHAPLSKPLRFVLEKASTGITLAELIQSLLDFDKDLGEDDVMEYLEEIINAQILISELEPNITGGRYLDRIIATLEKISCNNKVTLPIVGILKKIRADLASLSKENSKTYDQITAQLKAIIKGVDPNKVFIAHIEKLSTSKLVLDDNIQQELIDCIQFLEKIYPGRKNEALNTFLEKFYQRYETREVPILEALDPERGLGYPIGEGVVANSFLKDISFLENAPNKREIQWDSLTKKLFQLLNKYHSKQVDKIDLFEEANFQDFTVYNNKPFPASFDAVFSIIGMKNEHPEIVFHFAGGSSGVNLFTRFGKF